MIPRKYSNFLCYCHRLAMNGSNSSLVSQSFVNNTNEMQTSAVFVPIFQAIASSLVMIASLFGNTLVICVVLQSCRMRTVTNYLIVNMACADMLYTIVAMPPLFVSIFNCYAWALATRGRGIYFCKVVNFAQYMLVPVSVLTLAAIAFDRFFAILMPLKRIINKRVFYWILLVIWITSLAVATPTLYSLRVIESNGGLSCDENWAPAFDNETAPMIYMLVLFSVMLCLPLCVITVLYTIICRHLFLTKPPGETEREESKSLIRRRNSRKKVVKMLITVVVIFIVSWLPLQIANFIYYFDKSVIHIPEQVYFSCEFLMRSSCALNPAVYAIFSENYRQGFKKVLVKCCCFGRMSNFIRKNSSYSSSRQQTVPTILRSELGLSKLGRDSKRCCHDTGVEEEHQF